MAQLIPLSNAPNQQVRAALNINGETLTLNLDIRYNGQAGYWVMNVADQLGNPVVSSVPFVTGVWPAGNILAEYDYLGIGAAYIINQDGSQDWPDDTTLGSSFFLLWDSNPA